MAWNLSDVPENDRDRYEGRPLLLILEYYVLDCIGELEDAKRALMREWIQSAFGEQAGDDWRAAVRGQLRLGDTLDQALAEMWFEKSKLAADANVPLAADVFARMLVDQNFADLIDSADE